MGQHTGQAVNQRVHQAALRLGGAAKLTLPILVLVLVELILVELVLTKLVLTELIWTELIWVDLVLTKLVLGRLVLVEPVYLSLLELVLGSEACLELLLLLW